DPQPAPRRARRPAGAAARRAGGRRAGPPAGAVPGRGAARPGGAVVSLARPSTLWRYTARNLRRRPGRTLLTLLGIAIGVAAAVAVTPPVAAARQAHREMFDELAGRAALEVVAEGMGGFEEQAAPVASAPGVKSAVPAVQGPAALLGPSGAVPVFVVGSDPAR